MYRDSVGNTYRALPSRKPNPGAKGSKSGPRGDTKKREQRYAAQFGITAANIARRTARHLCAHPGDSVARAAQERRAA